MTDISQQLQSVEAVLWFFAKEPESAVHWIPMWYGDSSTDLCYDCAEMRIEQMRPFYLQDGDELFVDGGFLSEFDCPPQCENCGERLSYTLLDIGDELANYGPKWFHNAKASAISGDDAYCLSRVMEAASAEDEQPYLQKRALRVGCAAVEVIRRKNLVTIPPETDDG